MTLLDRGEVQGAIVTFDVAGRTAEEVQRHLSARRINVSVTEYTPGQIGAPAFATHVRSSVHYYNTEDEVDRLAETVERAATGTSSRAVSR